MPPKLTPIMFEKILIINLAFIGDVLLSTPVARALREKFPLAKIDMLSIPLTETIAKANPYIDEVLVYDKRGDHKKAKNLWRLLKKIRNRKYDLAVSTNFASRGAMLSFFAGIPVRAGYDAQHAKWFLTHAASSARPVIRHEAENYLDVLKPLGISTEDAGLAFKIDDCDITTMKKKIKRDFDKPLALLCPLGSYPKKNWTVEGYANLLMELKKSGFDCYIIGSKEQAQELNKINERSKNSAAVLAGTLTLGELAAFIQEASILISVDTGPMHIADALKTPLVALFGSTDPNVWGPRGEKSKVIYLAADCSPCWGRRDCQENICMQNISLEQIKEEAFSLLGGNPK